VADVVLRLADQLGHLGAYLVGLRGIVVIAHGNSGRRAICNAIHLAARGVEHDVVGRIEARLTDADSTPSVARAGVAAR